MDLLLVLAIVAAACSAGFLFALWRNAPRRKPTYLTVDTHDLPKTSLKIPVKVLLQDGQTEKFVHAETLEPLLFVGGTASSIIFGINPATLRAMIGIRLDEVEVCRVVPETAAAQ